MSLFFKYHWLLVDWSWLLDMKFTKYFVRFFISLLLVCLCKKIPGEFVCMWSKLCMFARTGCS
jgi:hypothetical protein